MQYCTNRSSAAPCVRVCVRACVCVCVCVWTGKCLLQRHNVRHFWETKRKTTWSLWTSKNSHLKVTTFTHIILIFSGTGGVYHVGAQRHKTVSDKASQRQIWQGPAGREKWVLISRSNFLYSRYRLLRNISKTVWHYSYMCLCLSSSSGGSNIGRFKQKWILETPWREMVSVGGGNAHNFQA